MALLLVELGKRVREARRRQQMTQEVLASRLDLEVSTIQAIEAGRRGVSVETLLRLTRTLHLSVGYLLGEEPIDPDSLAAEAARLVNNIEVAWRPVALDILRAIQARAAKSALDKG